MLLSLLVSPALAWNHAGWVAPEPLVWYRGPGAPEGISEEAFQAAFEDAFAQWTAPLTCSTLSIEHGGINEGAPSSTDQLFTIYPTDSEVWEGGMASTITQGEEAFSWDGMTYTTLSDFDIRFEGSGLTTAGAGCTDELVLETLALHMAGSMLGVDLSCSEAEQAGGDCTDAELDAVMYWALQPCEERALSDDDIAAIIALYEPQAAIAAADAGDAVAVGTGLGGQEQVSVCLDATSNADMASVAWDLGDGTTAADASICHDWTEPGEYTVSLSIQPDIDGCTEPLTDTLQVTVCETTADAPLEIIDEGGGVFAFRNLTEQSTCVSDAHWQITSPDGELVMNALSWDVQATLTAPGSYTVSLMLSGVGGEAESVETHLLEWEAEEADGCGGGSAALVGLFGLLGLRRSRR